MKTIKDIDFAALYKSHFELSARKEKAPEEWSKKALKMQNDEYDLSNAYVRDFMSKMKIESNDTLLDIGCGGGAIALNAAKIAKKVYALDFCKEMLDLVEKRAQKHDLTNVTTIQKAWADNWNDVPECDICVASRSSMVEDLDDALEKLNKKARKRVYMSIIAEKDFISRDILDFIGRKHVSFPNYIYTINLLYQKGYYAKVDFIDVEGCMTKPKKLTLDDLINGVTWSIGELSDYEKDRLKIYYETHSDLTSVCDYKRDWAFVSWETRR